MKKGERTKTLILDDALALAGEVGLEGLSIGSLAGRLGLSKSGLFAHFGSKEDLQLATLQHGQRRFEATVFRPALAIPRGLPRLRALFDNWLDWIARVARPGGCVLLAAAMEYDDRPGPVREALVAGQRELRGAVAKAVRLAIQEAHLCSDTDPWQLAFEVTGNSKLLEDLSDRGLLDDPRALNRARAAFERLIAAHVPVPAAA